MRPYRIWLVVLGMVAVCGLAGCGVEGGLVAMRDQAEGMRTRIEADRTGLLAAADALPQDGPARARIKQLADERGRQASETGRAIERLDALIAPGGAAGSGDPADTMQQAVGAVLPFVPAGAQLPVLLAGGLVASLWRAASLKKSAVSIAAGLEKAMREDDQLRDGVRRNAAVLRSVQTPTAKRIVDEATKDKAMVRLPV
ncbi:MAG: hypothetical protein H6810_06015 [Phycisphaeraceae bacterium]|nr:MAG: hypothetical protein H6810_06015 [Phycisphaeraceae bacterium]